MKRYGIIGGTFDPIHIGHLFIAEEIRCRFKLDKIIFVPNGNPPHKSGVTDKYDRLEMVKLAIEDNPNFEVSEIEMREDKKMYTIDTVKKLLETDSQNEYYFIFGSDSLYELHKWKDYRELLSLCKFIAIGRPGFSTSDIELPEEYRDRIDIFSTIEVPIDSTNIRKRVRNSENIKYLVSLPVERYIYKRKLYCQEEK